MEHSKVRMPVLFVGHGNPMNAIEDNELTRKMKEVGRSLPRPKGILCISAHWYTREYLTQSEPKPRQIYDMYGFPQELYQLWYEVNGSSELTSRVLDLLGDNISINDEWGIDHGTWSVLVHMFPDASIPVVQLSVNALATPEELVEVGKALRPLSEEGWLILGSGNILHNLRRIEWNREGGTPEGIDFDNWVRDCILEKKQDELIDYLSHPHAKYAVPTPDHFYPLYYVIGAADPESTVEVFNEVQLMGSLSMTSYLFHPPKEGGNA